MKDREAPATDRRGRHDAGGPSPDGAAGGRRAVRKGWLVSAGLLATGLMIGAGPSAVPTPARAASRRGSRFVPSIPPPPTPRRGPRAMAGAQAPPAGRPLDNAAVLSLLRAGFAPAVVAAQIRQAPRVQFDVAPKALAVLRTAGATPAVLVAMLARETPLGGRRSRVRLMEPTKYPPRTGPPVVYIWDRGHSGLAERCWEELQRRSRLRLAFSSSAADWLLVITQQSRGLRRREILQVFDNRTELLLWSGETSLTPFRRSAIRRLADRFLRSEAQWWKKGGAAGARTAPPMQR